jgi:putative transposase
MELIKTYKYKLKLSNKQEKEMISWINSCRFIYNVALEERSTAYKELKHSVTKYDQYNQLPLLKKEFPFISNVYSDTLQETLDRVDKAYQTFFRGGGYPKFAKKGFYKSFTFKRHFTVEDTFIKLPKLGRVKYFNSRPIIGEVKTATVIREDNGWFICIVARTNNEIETIEVDNQNPVGIDMGAIRFAALSNNTFIDSPKFQDTFQKDLRVLQRKLSRQKKGSKSREKTKSKVRKIYKKIANQRLNFLHKTSTYLADTYSAIYIEDLKLQKMQQQGISFVNRAMSDKSFYSFRLLLDYKLKERGKHMGLVNPAYTSQMCSSCNVVDSKSRVSQSDFVCTSCGEVSNADINASKNIISKGITESTKRKTLV